MFVEQQTWGLFAHNGVTARLGGPAGSDRRRSPRQRRRPMPESPRPPARVVVHSGKVMPADSIETKGANVQSEAQAADAASSPNPPETQAAQPGLIEKPPASGGSLTREQFLLPEIRKVIITRREHCPFRGLRIGAHAVCVSRVSRSRNATSSRRAACAR